MVGRVAGQGDGGTDVGNIYSGGTGVEIRKTPAAVRLRAFVGQGVRFKISSQLSGNPRQDNWMESLYVSKRRDNSERT